LINIKFIKAKGDVCTNLWILLKSNYFDKKIFNEVKYFKKKIKFKQIYIYKLLTKFLKYLDIVFKHFLIQIIKLLITIFYQ
jgi:hypothetical protein